VFQPIVSVILSESAGPARSEGCRCLSFKDLPAELSKIVMKKEPNPEVTPERLMQFGFSYAPPLIIGAAVSNKVFDTLASGPKSLEEMSRETGASTRGLRAIMNALVGLELLAKDNGKYTLTPESENFLVSNKPGTLAGFFSMNRLRLMQLWMKLDEIVRTGQPAEARNLEGPGTEFFSELVENIIPMSYGSARTLADHLKVADAKNTVRVLDLAAGSGIWGIALAQKSPRVEVTAVDWAGMIPTTRRITKKFWAQRSFQIYRRRSARSGFRQGLRHRHSRPHSAQRRRRTKPEAAEEDSSRAEERRHGRDRRVVGKRRSNWAIKWFDVRGEYVGQHRAR